MGGARAGRRLAWWLALALGALTACRETPVPTGPTYTDREPTTAKLRLELAIHPLHNPVALFRIYQPLADYLNQNQTDVQVVLQASRDYGDYLAKIRQRAPALLLPNPWQTLQAQRHGYHVLAMAGDPHDFRGIMLARRDDTELKHATDLRGSTIAYPAPTAIAACVLPQLWMQKQGLMVMREVTNQYVGSQEAAILAVSLGKARLGVTWPPPWRLFQREHPAEAAQLRVAFETESLLNNSLMVRDDVPAAVAERLRNLVLHLGDTSQGQALLAAMETSAFLPADDHTYAQVKEVIDEFERTLRPVEAP